MSPISLSCVLVCNSYNNSLLFSLPLGMSKTYSCFVNFPRTTVLTTVRSTGQSEMIDLELGSSWVSPCLLLAILLFLKATNSKFDRRAVEIFSVTIRCTCTQY